MRQATAPEADPIRWCAALALAFLALALFRLGIPSEIYFDEVHYVPAARKLLQLRVANREHPLLGKEIIAASIALLGDRPFAWRLPSALMAALGLFAFGRAVWFTSGRRFATLAAMLLVSTGFAWFVAGRIAMLDMHAAALAMVALWQFCAATRSGKPRLRLAVSGFAMGLALGAKWSAIPVIVLPGLTFLMLRLRDRRGGFLTATGTGPVRAVSLVEAGLWLGVLPLAVYWLTFTPAVFYRAVALDPLDIVGQHRLMIGLQDSVMKFHPYRSEWWQWVINWRPIWYLYEPVDGAWRGILMLGNPFTMLAALPALGWCLWAGFRKGREDALAMVAAYGANLAFWIASSKPVMFYYHYLLPGTFLLGCLALALDELWRRGTWARLAALCVPGLSVGVFVRFYPILSAAPLAGGKNAFVAWMWLDSWR